MQAEGYRATLNHELRTPIESCIFLLNKLLDEISLQAKDRKVARQCQRMKLIISQLTFAQSFVEDILNVTQLKNGAFQLTEAAFDPQKVFDYVKGIFEPLLKAKGVALNFDVVKKLQIPKNRRISRDINEPELLVSKSRVVRIDASKTPGSLPPILIGDERRLRKVLINLVKNAKMFTNLGAIDIKTSFDRKKELLVVHVNDTGSGIAEDDLPKLFNKFGKLHRTAEMNSEGLGLGLTIVQGIVESAGGKIVALSPGLGQGSTFCFSMQMRSTVTNQEVKNFK